jgi:hypothetical protein
MAMQSGLFEHAASRVQHVREAHELQTAAPKTMLPHEPAST